MRSSGRRSRAEVNQIRGENQRRLDWLVQRVEAPSRAEVETFYAERVSTSADAPGSRSSALFSDLTTSAARLKVLRIAGTRPGHVLGIASIAEVLRIGRIGAGSLSHGPGLNSGRAGGRPTAQGRAAR
jgi:hypothetical protein